MCAEVLIYHSFIDTNHSFTHSLLMQTHAPSHNGLHIRRGRKYTKYTEFVTPHVSKSKNGQYPCL